MMSRGVPAGARSANQSGTSTPSTPASFIVGTSGMSSVRPAPATASRAQAAGLHVLADGERVDERELHFAGDERGKRRRAALVGHMHDVRAGADLEKLGGEMLGRAGTGGRIVERPGLPAREGNELLDVAHRQGGGDDEQVRA